MILLFLSIAVLILAPVVFREARTRPALLAAIDGFVFAAVAGMVLFDIVPETVARGTVVALVWLAAGALGPTLSEALFRGTESRSHNIALVFGLLGLALHGMMDGAALASGNWHAGSVLPLAVVLHRLPAGLVIWMLLRPAFGTRVAVSVLGVVVVTTVIGYGFGADFLGQVSSHSVAWFEAFVAGALLHVVVHRPHRRGEPGFTASQGRAEGAGAVIGVLFLAIILWPAGAEGSAAGPVGQHFLALALESAPALVLAYAMAGVMSVMLPQKSVEWMSRGPPLMQALRGMTIGLPLPICSCGVVPLYHTLTTRGAPLAAGMAFLVATPELGLDAIFLSVPLLGGTMTIIRLIGAIVVALLVGWIVARLAGADSVEVAPTPVLALPGKDAAWPKRIARGLRTGFGDVVDHTAPWIILGLAIAALATPLAEGGWLASIPRNLDVLVFAVVGLPIYVCAAAATPFVAILLAGGVSPGAALAFLLTGPATNVTTFGILTQLHGRRTALIFSVTIIGLSVTLGWVVNAIVPSVTGISLAELDPEAASPLQVVALIVLVLAVLGSLLRRGARAFVDEIAFQTSSPAPPEADDCCET